MGVPIRKAAALGLTSVAVAALLLLFAANASPRLYDLNSDVSARQGLGSGSLSNETSSSGRAESQESRLASAARPPPQTAAMGVASAPPTAAERAGANEAIMACLDTQLATDDARRACVDAINAASPIFNVERYPIPADPAAIPGVVIVIPIYDRHEHLRFVLEALARNAYINETTILVSMDKVCEPIMDVVRAFQAARIKVVYHAYSAAFLKDVLWAEFLHRYQRTRHHYNWLWHYLYRTSRTPEFLPPGGDVFFLEDDLFPLDDLYPAVRALHKLWNGGACPPNVCFCVNVGQPQSRTPKNQPSDRFGVAYSTLSSWGWGVNRASMEFVFKAARTYCDYNDYNHDWSLAHLAQQNLIGPQCLNTHWSRVYHFGLCGNHFHGADCSAAHAVEQLHATVIAPHMAAIGDAIQAARAWDTVADAPERVPSPQDDAAFLDPPRATSRPTFSGNEGWTFGRIFDRDFRPGDPLYDDRDHRPKTWTLMGHRDHCYRLLGVL